MAVSDRYTLFSVRLDREDADFVEILSDPVQLFQSPVYFNAGKLISIATAEDFTGDGLPDLDVRRGNSRLLLSDLPDGNRRRTAYRYQ